MYTLQQICYTIYMQINIFIYMYNSEQLPFAVLSIFFIGHSKPHYNNERYILVLLGADIHSSLRVYYWLILLTATAYPYTALVVVDCCAV